MENRGSLEGGNMPENKSQEVVFKLADTHADYEKNILTVFTPEQQSEIKEKVKILSSLGYFIGKDFDIPIYLNTPGEGWFWDAENNFIKVDPIDILEKPMEYLRFVICHEGGHRRISRVDFIPKETWSQLGFSQMMNAIEDPRENNFVAEAYPIFKEQMIFSYNHDHMEQQKKLMETEGKTKLGFVPRYELASFEYINQWFREVQGKPFEIDPALPEDVKEVIGMTLSSAQASWWRYPSREEADTSESLIREYAKASYEINRDKIWPYFKTLVEKDIEDVKKKRALEELRKDKEQSEKLEEVSFDEEALEKLIQQLFESLPEEVKQEIMMEVFKTLSEFEEYVQNILDGKTTEGNFDSQKENKNKAIQNQSSDGNLAQKEMQKIVERRMTEYQSALQEVLPIAKELEDDLREIFVKRRAKKWETGFRTGKKIDIKKRIQEKAKGVNVFESRAWQKREHPLEKDYAITILVDLSASMRLGKIEEAFKAVVMLSEVLSKIGIHIEVLGFNTKLHEYKSFPSDFSEKTREHFGNMLKEVHSVNARGNDDGWALSVASQRLEKQKQDEKLILVISDGAPAPVNHFGEEFELENVIHQVLEKTNQKLVGLGIGQGTEHVKDYYPNSVANINLKDMAKELAGIIKEAIAHSDNF